MTIVENRTITVTGGVHTHLDFHVAAAVDQNGGVLGVETFDTTTGGYCPWVGKPGSSLSGEACPCDPLRAHAFNSKCRRPSVRRLLAISALTLAACTPSGTNDAFTVPDPPDGLALTTIEEYELTERTHESTGDITFTAEEIRLHQAMTGGSMTLGGGTRQVYGADQGSAASWNDINNLAGEAGFVLSTFPMTGDHGIEVVRAIRNPLGVSAAQITDQSGGLITAAASNSETDTSYFLVWQQSKHWIVLYSDTVPLSDLTSIAGRVAPARLSNLQDELNG